jgi:hypothetical protein
MPDPSTTTETFPVVPQNGAAKKAEEKKPDATLAPHAPIGVWELKSGKIMLLTEGRVYEYLHGKWHPTVFTEQENPETYHERTAPKQYGNA